MVVVKRSLRFALRLGMAILLMAAPEARAWIVEFDRFGFEAGVGTLGYGDLAGRQYRAGQPIDASLGNFQAAEPRGRAGAGAQGSTADSRGSGARTAVVSLASKPESPAASRRAVLAAASPGRRHGSLPIVAPGATAAFSFTFDKPSDLLSGDMLDARTAPCAEGSERACAEATIGFLDGSRMPVPLPQGFGQQLAAGASGTEKLGQVNFDLRDKRTDLVALAASGAIDMIRRAAKISEPTPLALLAIGAFCLALFARRRRQHKFRGHNT
ncbi:MAG: PEP-CTERM sorting domain-containing protein [Alphaproteobacteria bacterium]|nr:PEP-CTERM sorting domain-containing protein [Alphaproteobacteria bacterium]